MSSGQRVDARIVLSFVVATMLGSGAVCVDARASAIPEESASCQWAGPGR